MRFATILLCVIGAVIWAGAAWATFLSGADPATRSLDILAGSVATLLFATTTGVSVLLTVTGRAPRAAFWLALVFPLGLLVLFAGTVIAFA